jgi:Protein of unknown function (DUF2892)
MTAIDAVGSQPGRVLRIVAGVALIGWGLQRGDSRGRTVAALGLVPLTAGAGDFCLLGPLVRAPLGGQAFREQRALQR